MRTTSAQRGYGSRWQRYRLRYLQANPICANCLRAGRTTAATVVDHIDAHRGDHAKFWNPTNHQPLCSTCHSGDKQREEKGGGRTYRGCSVDGTPLDPDHHWKA